MMQPPVQTVVFDPTAGGSWHQMPDMARARYRHTATTLADGSMLVVGGADSMSGAYIDQAELFVP